MSIKANTEYIITTGSVIDSDGNIPLERKQEIVRCKDCKFWTKTIGRGEFSWELEEGECRNDRYFTEWQERRPITPEDHFCADGERKES